MATGFLKKPVFIKKYKIVFWIVLVLLFLMGFETGSNQLLFESLPELGWWGFVIAAFSTGGSVLFVLIFELLLRKRKAE
jgi:hypothetical protein